MGQVLQESRQRPRAPYARPWWENEASSRNRGAQRGSDPQQIPSGGGGGRVTRKKGPNYNQELSGRDGHASFTRRADRVFETKKFKLCFRDATSAFLIIKTQNITTRLKILSRLTLISRTNHCNNVQPHGMSCSDLRYLATPKPDLHWNEIQPHGMLYNTLQYLVTHSLIFCFLLYNTFAILVHYLVTHSFIFCFLSIVIISNTIVFTILFFDV